MLRDSPAQILVIDDDWEVLDLLERILLGLKYVTITANSAKAAFEALSNQPVDLIISDMHMPDVTGLALFVRLRATRSMRPVPFVIITGQEGWGDRFSAEQAGVARFLNKPIDRAQLAQCLQELLEPATPALPSPVPSGVSQPHSRPPAGLHEGSEVRLAVPVQELVKSHGDLPQADAYVLSRLAAGDIAVGGLFHLCPQPPEEVVAILQRLIAAGLVSATEAG